MDRRWLGRTRISVPPLCFGGNVFGWTADEATSFALLDRLHAYGICFLDTADVYSAWAPGNRGGESETIIGRWMASRGCRADVVIATKVGKSFGPGPAGLSAANIARAVDASLLRLRTDYIDLYQAHEDDPAVAPEDTLGAFGRLVEAGKIRAAGVSNIGVERLTLAGEVSRDHGLQRYETVQLPYNLHGRGDFEGAMQAHCLHEGISVLPYAALAQGFLTGKYRSLQDAASSARGRRIQGLFDASGLRVLSALQRASALQGASMAQVALAWVMAQPGVTAPIVSTTTVPQLEELLGALDLMLSSEVLQILQPDRIGDMDGRYPG